jgi:hypothetical protein
VDSEADDDSDGSDDSDISAGATLRALGELGGFARFLQDRDLSSGIGELEEVDADGDDNDHDGGGGDDDLGPVSLVIVIV